MKTAPKSTDDYRRHQQMYARRKAAGLCKRCSSPAVEGILMCEFHRRQANSRPGNNLNCRAKRERRLSAGLCVRCSQAAVQGQTLCEKHRAQYKTDAIARKDKIRAYKRSILEIQRDRKRSPKYKAQRNETRRKDRAENPERDIADRLRKRIGRAIRDYAPGRKSLRTAALIGCPIPELLIHLEAQFLPGMTWQNRNQWHIDHIRPCASFDLTDPAQQQECFHYMNLQPLWALDNIQKHAKL